MKKGEETGFGGDSTGIGKRQAHTGKRLGQRRQRLQGALVRILAELLLETQLGKALSPALC